MQFYRSETVRFIKTSIVMYVALMDCGAGHLTIIVGTGVGHLPTNLPKFVWGRAFTNKFAPDNICPNFSNAQEGGAHGWN